MTFVGGVGKRESDRGSNLRNAKNAHHGVLYCGWWNLKRIRLCCRCADCAHPTGPHRLPARGRSQRRDPCWARVVASTGLLSPLWTLPRYCTHSASLPTTVYTSDVVVLSQLK